MKKYLSFLLLLLIVISCREESSIQNKNAEDIKTIVIIFIQADYNINEQSEVEVFYDQLNYLVSDEFKKRFKEKYTLSTIIAYPLDGNTKDAKLLSKIEGLEKMIKYDRGVEIDEFLDRTYEKYKNNVKNNKEFRQDIVGSYNVLRDKADYFIDYKNINVIYLSDMVHYTVEHEHQEPERGYYAFTNSDALEAFRSQVERKQIKTPQGQYEIKELYPKKRITVTVIKPRKRLKRKNYNMVKHLGIDSVWRLFFVKYGADDIKYNM